jgi:hypothetical protein
MPHPHILICLPTYSEEVHINFAFSLMNVTRAINESGATFETLHVASSHIIRARNFFANYFLNHSEFTHLLFLDTDMQFPPEAVIKLLKANKPLAGVAYPYRRVDLDRKIDETAQGLTMREWLETHADYTVTILSNADGSAQIVDGFVEAEHVGTGIFLAQPDRCALRSIRSIGTIHASDATARPARMSETSQRPTQLSGIVQTLQTSPLPATSRAAFAPSTCRIVGNDTPFFAAVTSARIETAISGGVRLPI